MEKQNNIKHFGWYMYKFMYNILGLVKSRRMSLLRIAITNRMANKYKTGLDGIRFPTHLCDEYLKWAKSTNLRNLTNSQVKFANFLLSNKEQLPAIGNVDYVFKDISLFLKGVKSNEVKNQEYSSATFKDVILQGFMIELSGKLIFEKPEHEPVESYMYRINGTLSLIKELSITLTDNYFKSIQQNG